MRIAVVGSGYVGLAAAACFAELGHTIISVDNDPSKVARLNAGNLPIREPFLTELVQRHLAGRLMFSQSVPDAVASSEIIFIAVGTPATESGEADLSYVETVSREIASCLDG